MSKHEPRFTASMLGKAMVSALAKLDPRVEFRNPFPRKRCAPARVEQRIVLEETDRRDDRIETRPAGLEQRVAAIERGGQGIAVEPLLLARQVLSRQPAGAAMNRDGIHIERVPRAHRARSRYDRGGFYR